MYAKVFTQMLDGSIVEEPIGLRWLWVCLLMLADEDGTIEMTPAAIARRINMPLAEVESGLERLCSPDPQSRTTTDEGRRLRAIPGKPWGWTLVNHAKYRGMRSANDRREYMRGYMRQYRSENVPPSPPSANTDADVDTETDTGVNVCKPCKQFTGTPPVAESGTEPTDPTKSGQTPSDPEKPRQRGRRAASPGRYEPAPIPDVLAQIEGFADAWEGYLENRAAKKDGRATKHAQEILLQRLAERPGDAVAGLREATLANWTGFRWEWYDGRVQSVARPNGSAGKSPEERKAALDKVRRDLEAEFARKRREGIPL